MDTELKSLRIDRSRKPDSGSPWLRRLVIAIAILIVLLVVTGVVYSKLNGAREVELLRVKAASSAVLNEPGVILNATGYIIAAHKIQVASKVLGRVAWIGVEKGDRVKEGQVIVRLEDDEYRAQLQQARGQFESLRARLEEMQNGSRPEEIAKAKADVEQAKADLDNARVTLNRTRRLVDEGVLSRQSLDDQQARLDAATARVAALERTHDLVRIGPRREQIDSMRGQLEQARGGVAFCEMQRDNTVIKAPVSGTILERAVEKGEFVTTSFVGDRGAKGYVVSLADLNDLQVELDINQNDFARLGPKQRGTVTTDAYPDRKYEGFIEQIAPEANRQKATVQVKVRVLRPDEYLRPDMNASVAFLGEEKPRAAGAPPAARVVIPPAAVRNGAVFVAFNGKAVRRPVKTGASTSAGIRIEAGLIGGEDLIVQPPDDLKDGDRIRPKKQ